MAASIAASASAVAAGRAWRELAGALLEARVGIVGAGKTCVSRGALAGVIAVVAVLAAALAQADILLAGVARVAVGVCSALTASAIWDALTAVVEQLAAVACGAEVVCDARLGAVFAVGVCVAGGALIAVGVGGALPTEFGRRCHGLWLAKAAAA